MNFLHPSITLHNHRAADYPCICTCSMPCVDSQHRQAMAEETGFSLLLWDSPICFVRCCFVYCVKYNSVLFFPMIVDVHMLRCDNYVPNPLAVARFCLENKHVRAAEPFVHNHLFHFIHHTATRNINGLKLACFFPPVQIVDIHAVHRNSIMQ